MEYQYSSSALSSDELRRIAQIASSVWDHRQFCGGTEPHTVDPTYVESLATEWARTVADGNRELFERRLRHAQIDVDDLAKIFASYPRFDRLPDWTEILNQILGKMAACREAVRKEDLRDNFDFLRDSSPIHFEEAFLPFVAVAVERLSASTSGQYSFYAAKMRASFERALIKTLAAITGQVLIVEFRTFLANLQLTGGAYPEASARKNSRKLYLRFVDELYDNGWKALLSEYCVLARLIAVAVAQWVENTSEFLRRFERDLPDIRTIFLSTNDRGRLVDVQTGLSDPHNGGRVVILLQFESGARLVYKPKSTRLEAEYFLFLGWLNETAGLLPFRCLKTLSREDYGWSEYVQSHECESEEDVHRFYYRLGMFLCLVYAFNGIDFHFENLIAAGEHPVPVDLETLFHEPGEASIDEMQSTDAVAQRLRNSVLRAHILPHAVRRNSRYADISAIANDRDEVQAPIWTNINTDAMDYRYGEIKRPGSQNTPRLHGENPAPDRYVTDISDGFEALYRVFLARKEELISESGPLHPMFACDSRFIFRATSFYDSVLYQALAPDALRDGLRFSLKLEVLAKRLAMSDAKPEMWQVLEHEIRALSALDVPKFGARGTSKWLAVSPETVIADYFERSAWERTKEKIRLFDEIDLDWQRLLIRAAMDASVATRIVDENVSCRPETGCDVEVGPRELADHALSFADSLGRSAIYSDSGEPSWLTLNYLSDANRFILQAIPFDLYNGRSGIALFLAATETALPGSGFRDLAYATIAPVRRWIGKATQKDVLSMGIGGYLGVPSLVYALTKMGELLADGALLEDARHAVSLIDKTTINHCRANDVVGGAAGAILALLACRNTLANPEIVPMAMMCGDALLQRRASNDYGFRTWPDFRGTHLTGFSHGSSGIARALLTLYRETGEARFYDAAIEAFEFENAEFIPQENNWPDRRRRPIAASSPKAQDFKIAWCHGAPGIGLARLATLDVHDTPRIRADIDAALSATTGCDLLSRDHLCCGNAGLTEMLLQASMTLANDRWKRQALRIASQMIVRAEKAGGFAVRLEHGFIIPSLFQGPTGIGYQFLRLAFPGRIPSVLSLS